MNMKGTLIEFEQWKVKHGNRSIFQGKEKSERIETHERQYNHDSEGLMLVGYDLRGD